MKITRALLGLVFVAAASPSFGTIITYAGVLSGANENPPTGSPGGGFASVAFDNVANTLHVQVIFYGLAGTTTASHVHCCLPLTTVATTTPTFANFPLGVKSGTYDNTLDLNLLSSYNPAFISMYGGTVASAEPVLIAGLAAGTAYLNVHSTVNPGGELRANLAPVPEPGTFGLVGVTIAGLFALKRRFTRSGAPR
jgi:hypothetical protein